MVGVHLHLIQFWPLNLESIENMVMHQNICLYTFTQCWRTKLRKTKSQRYSYIGSACAKSLRNRRMKVHQDHSKTYQELITGMLNSLLYAGGDAEGSNYKISRNLDKQINIVSMFVSRIILKLFN